jgi:hypothetical protein
MHTHGRQDSDKIATVLPGHFQCRRRGYRRNAAGKPPADTPLPTRRANGDARQCDGANGLKGKMPSWGMGLSSLLTLAFCGITATIRQTARVPIWIKTGPDDPETGLPKCPRWHVSNLPILLQKSKVASVRIFGETLKREAIDDSNDLSRITEVAYEFSVRR